MGFHLPQPAQAIKDQEIHPLPAPYSMGAVVSLQSVSNPFIPPVLTLTLLCFQDYALVSVRPLHPSVSLC